MFWIFGGYFQQGNNAWWAYGPDNWIERDVIMVQPNHRLGVFGFTSLGIPEAPGNQGLRDLVAALQWVQDNIEEFGGDKERVTIYGESSGSWAVSYLHLTPYANGQSVILTYPIISLLLYLKMFLFNINFTLNLIYFRIVQRSDHAEWNTV